MEAQYVFYSCNIFQFSLLDPADPTSGNKLGRIKRFMNTIGPLNASYIRRLQIDWPDIILGLSSDQSTGFRQPEETLLDLLRTKCPNIQTLVLSRFPLTKMLLRLWAYRSDDIDQSYDRILKFLDIKLRAIGPVKIVVDKYPMTPSWAGTFIDKAGELGWKIIK